MQSGNAIQRTVLFLTINLIIAIVLVAGESTLEYLIAGLLIIEGIGYHLYVMKKKS